MEEIEIDRSYRGRIGKLTDPSELGISSQIIKKKNNEKSWRYGEHPEYHKNFICISKNGTLGDIYLVDNLYIGLPSQEGYNIMNEGLSGKDAKWHRSKERPFEFEE